MDPRSIGNKEPMANHPCSSRHQVRAAREKAMPRRIGWRTLVLFVWMAFVWDGWTGMQARAEEDRSQSKPRSVREIEGIVRDYLLRNPEVVEDALRALHRKRQETRAEAARRVIAERSQELFHDTGSPVGGNPKGDVTLVEFFDYRCGHCRRVTGTLKAIQERDPKLRVVYKEFPILGPGSVLAAKAALASRSQGKYLPFHNVLMKHAGPFSEEGILKAAESVGLDAERLKRDMEDPDIRTILERNRRLADALGITGTPVFVIGDELIPGAVGPEKFRELIALARTRKGR